MHYGDAPHDLSPPGPSNAARRRRVSLSTFLTSGLLGLNALLGSLAVLASPGVYAAMFAACLALSVTIWYAVRHQVSGLMTFAGVAFVLIVAALMIANPASALNVQTVDIVAGDDVRGDEEGGILAACVSTSGATQTAKWQESTDNGQTWSNAVDIVTQSAIAHCIARIGPGDERFAVIENGVDVDFYYSDDGGATWTERSPPNSLGGTNARSGYDYGHDNDVHVITTYNTTASELWSMRSTDDGATWSGSTQVSALSTAIAAPPFDGDSLVYDANGHLWAWAREDGAFDDVHIFSSTDDGVLWNDQTDTGLTEERFVTLFGIRPFASGGGFASSYDAAGSGGVNPLIYYSSDGGIGDEIDGNDETRTASVENPAGTNLVALYKRDDTAGWEVRTSTDLGLTWSSATTIDTDATNTNSLTTRTVNSTAIVGFRVASGTAQVVIIDKLPDAPDLQLSITGGRDVRTDYENDPTVYFKSDGATAARGQINSVNKNLGGLQTRTACPDPKTTGSSSYGLSVTFDQFILWPCLASGGATPIIRQVGSISQSAVVERTLQTDGTGTVEGLSSTTLNDVSACEEVRDFYRIDMATAGLGQKWRRELGGIEACGIDIGTDANHTWAVSDTLGVRGYNHQGINVASAPSVLGVSIAAHNNTIYVGNSTRITSYSVEGGTLVSQDFTSTATRVGGLRTSKDGNYLVSWTGSTVTLTNATNTTNLGSLSSFTASDSIQSCDMDVRNNRIYCVTSTQLIAFEVFDFTSSISGPGTPGAENPVLDGPVGGGGQFGGESQLPGTPSEPSEPSGTLFPTDGLETQLGSEGAAKAFLGLFLVLFAAAGFWAIGSNLGKSSNVSPFMPMTGAIGGFVAAVQFGFFPNWALMLLVITLIAGVIFLRRGS